MIQVNKTELEELIYQRDTLRDRSKRYEKKLLQLNKLTRQNEKNRDKYLDTIKKLTNKLKNLSEEQKQLSEKIKGGNLEPEIDVYQMAENPEELAIIMAAEELLF